MAQNVPADTDGITCLTTATTGSPSMCLACVPNPSYTGAPYTVTTSPGSGCSSGNMLEYMSLAAVAVSSCATTPTCALPSEYSYDSATVSCAPIYGAIVTDSPPTPNCLACVPIPSVAIRPDTSTAAAAAAAVAANTCPAGQMFQNVPVVTGVTSCITTPTTGSSPTCLSCVSIPSVAIPPDTSASTPSMLTQSQAQSAAASTYDASSYVEQTSGSTTTCVVGNLYTNACSCPTGTTATAGTPVTISATISQTTTNCSSSLPTKSSTPPNSVAPCSSGSIFENVPAGAGYTCSSTPTCSPKALGYVYSSSSASCVPGAGTIVDPNDTPPIPMCLACVPASALYVNGTVTYGTPVPPASAPTPPTGISGAAATASVYPTSNQLQTDPYPARTLPGAYPPTSYVTQTCTANTGHESICSQARYKSQTLTQNLLTYENSCPAGTVQTLASSTTNPITTCASYSGRGTSRRCGSWNTIGYDTIDTYNCSASVVDSSVQYVLQTITSYAITTSTGACAANGANAITGNCTCPAGTIPTNGTSTVAGQTVINCPQTPQSSYTIETSTAACIAPNISTQTCSCPAGKTATSSGTTMVAGQTVYNCM